jgi:hypothetical protein
MAPPRNPMIAILDVGSLNRRPRGPVGDLLLPAVPRMCGKAMVEGFAIDILRMRRQMAADRKWQVVIREVGHRVPGQLTSQSNSAMHLAPMKPCSGQRTQSGAASREQASSGDLDGNRFLGLDRLGFLRKLHRQHALCERCFDFVGVHVLRHSKGSLERAEVTLLQIVITAGVPTPSGLSNRRRRCSAQNADPYVP